MKHHDIFSYLDEAFGFVEDDLISSRMEEDIEMLRVVDQRSVVSLARNDAIASVLTHCVKDQRR